MAPSRTSRRESVISLETPERSLVAQESVATAGTSTVAMAKSSSEITPSMGPADIFKADLENIKSLVTCTICDQLLYEPWMLACGHTYCYSCLCNWFLPNRRSKSCPDCRSAVKAMPAPAFVIKQLAEVFVSRVELMPADESTEQHVKRRKEENQAVETDRISDEGLFKGCFSTARLGNIRYDEADRMHVCSHCGHEFTGGPLCENCGVDFEGEDEAIRDDFSDLEEMEFDLDEEEDGDAEEGEDDIEDEDYFHGRDPREGLDWFDPFDGAVQFEDVRQLLEDHPAHHHHHHHHHPHYHHLLHPMHMEARVSRARGEHSDESEEEESDGDETTSSMMDFIEPDDSSPAVGRRSRPQIIDSDSDDSDEEDEEEEEEEEVVSSRPRLQARRRPNRPIVVDSDSEVSADSGDGQGESEGANHPDIGDEHESDSSARNGGYSPLDHGDDSENDEAEPFAAVDHHSGTGDSETTVGRHELDDEDDRGATSCNDGPAVSRRGGEAATQRCPFHRRSGSTAKTQRERISAGPQGSREQSLEENLEDRDEERISSPAAVYDASDDENEATDEDGDIEMDAKSGMRGSVPEPDLLSHNALDEFFPNPEIWLEQPAPPAPRARRRRGAPAQMSPTQDS
ncbi:hypothetical protein VC83_06963 [Pseudogymnoascus destructans]|uniref:RING-type domain-containing protein n=1 Tax=Pseudogymnoascus destructans TaxID=655981 RepID=A0A177A3S5_9PEZI|nr:uncharacterized protein VC83_06963 [Pseudogymnoascus destructans]OAF56939.1 hypothetical protein VC83_06963 [Pseudogymnoascus destructans]